MKNLFSNSFSLAWLTLIFVANMLPAQDLDIDQLQGQLFSTIDKVAPSVVSVGIRGGEFSGVIVTPEGHVLSAGHAVRPGQAYRVLLPDGRRFSARGMGSSEQLDCGLIKITAPKNLPFVEMGNSLRLTPNQPCLSLSYPAGRELRGRPVARFGRIVRSRTGQGMVQSSALMEPGDSGGPLFDLNGQVIAIHSRIGRSMDRNYEVPVETFRKFWQPLNRAEKFGVSPNPSTPKLGFYGVESEEGDGLVVTRVSKGGIAESAGLEIGDLLTKIQNESVTSIRELQDALSSAKKKREKEIEVIVDRAGDRKKLTFPLKAKLITKTSPVPVLKKTPSPQAILELADLPRHFTKLEAKLDDNCASVSSTIGDEETQIEAMRVANSAHLISKNSMVGQNPFETVDGKKIELSVIARDEENDLVLLRSPIQNKTGVDLSAEQSERPRKGRFLISPDSNGLGKVSIWGSPEFTSQKLKRRGYLGVLPNDHEDGGAILAEVNRGAARKAGLKAGDIIKKLNDTEIETSNDLRRFLSQLDPDNTVTAIVQRGDEEIEKSITLGAAPSNSNHTADMMEKSGRRDGFSRVFAHDADLKPDNCGGPLFDLKGNFLGINIARHSRVRSFTIPVSKIKEFVAKNSNK